jgi:VIT1/CCC1 family predicted Fe2+/Mn2+ transporter
MKSINIHSLNFFLTIIFLCGCASSKKPYYFSWTTVGVKGNESSNFALLATDSVKKSSQFQANAGSIPVNFSRIKLNTEGQRNMQVTQYRIQDQVKPIKRDMLSGLLKQKRDTTVSEEGKLGSPRKNKYAESGFLSGVVGLIVFLVGVFSLNSFVILVAGHLFVLGFILSLVGLDSERKKLAKAGVFIFGSILTAFLIGFVAFAFNFGFII